MEEEKDELINQNLFDFVGSSYLPREPLKQIANKPKERTLEFKGDIPKSEIIIVRGNFFYDKEGKIFFEQDINGRYTIMPYDEKHYNAMLDIITKDND